MSLFNEIEKQRIRFQQRYANEAKKLKRYESGKVTFKTKTDKEVAIAYQKGMLNQLSYTLINVFGLTSKEVDELEKHDCVGLLERDMED